MLKLLFWAVIGYVVYRYFQMKGQIKEGRHRSFMQHPTDGGTQQPPPPKPAPEKRQNDGEFIDYEEVK